MKLKIFVFSFKVPLKYFYSSKSRKNLAPKVHKYDKKYKDLRTAGVVCVLIFNVLSIFCLNIAVNRVSEALIF